MSRPSPHPLQSALEAETGRQAPTDAVDKAWRDHARLLIQIRRRVLESEPCPQAYLRRAQGLFQAPATASGLLRLVFDSWGSLQPALRGSGGARSLRYETGDAAVDVRLVAEANDRILFQIAVDPARAGLSIELSRDPGGRPRAVTLDETGSAQVRLPRTTPSVVVVVREGEREVLRLPPVPLD